MKIPLADLLMHRLPPCVTVTEQISAAFECKLNAGERLALWMHLRVCPDCRRFSHQLTFLSQAMAEARKEARLMSLSKIPPLSYSAREKIKSAINAYFA